MTVQKTVRRSKVGLILVGSVAMSVLRTLQTGIIPTGLTHDSNTQRGLQSSDDNNIATVLPVVSVVTQYKEYFKKENLQDGPHICGAKKCMIPLKQDASVGYLVVNARQPGNFPLRMAQAYNFSQSIIEEQYNMSHVYLDEPYETKVDDDFVQWMRNDQIAGYYGQKTVASFSKHGHWLVQPISVVSQDSSILFGCESKRIKDAIYNLHQMGDQYFKEKSDQIDYQSLKERVSMEFDKLFDLLHDHPCLYDDFQMFLDASSGNIIHIDVDRCFPLKDDESKYRDVETSCLPLMKDFKGYIISKLSEFQQRYSSKSKSESQWVVQRLLRTFKSSTLGTISTSNPPTI